MVYSQGCGALAGYLCRPEGEGSFPAVIYNHGGIGKDIRGTPIETCEALAKAGFVGFAPIRRLTESLEGHVDDVKAGLDDVKALQGSEGFFWKGTPLTSIQRVQCVKECHHKRNGSGT